MKLAALGVVTIAIGAGLGIHGLIGIGAFWVLLGPLVRRYATRLKALQAASPDGEPAVGARTFATGTVLWLLLGVPSLVVGVLGTGFDHDDAGWRWLPLAVGGLGLGIGVVGAVLYLLGSAALARGGGEPDVPATLRITSVRETGSYVNERPRLEFVFAVEPDAGSGVAAYEVTKKATTPFTAMGSLKVGDGFRAKVVGPEHPTSMDIAWDQPVPAAGTEDVAGRLDALEVLRRDGRITDTEYDEQRARILGTL
ncbi:MAG: hypothetical protein ACJ72D_07365 [Marmoricola sp.]